MSLVSPAPTEERRLVTALFCDLVGFTPLSESLDPEEVRDLQSAYFEAMCAQIERYKGTVEKYAGDAILALFGAPLAHEDDAERAVLCALGMQETIEPVALAARTRWNAEPAIRVGINTGEVVSGTWDAGGRQDVAVTGDALNTAARIQATAEPGEILVGAETMRLTRRRIRYGEGREVTLKGKVGPVPLWPALGVREEFGERWEGYETPLVGRDREMVQLLDAWVRTQGGEGQLVTVVGDAGVGKSRLLAEFLGTIAPSSAVRILRARSLSYGEEISLWLVADLLRSLVGIKEQESLADVALKLQSAIPALIEDATTRAEALDVLGEVLGLPIGASPVDRAGPQIRRNALVRSMRAVLAGVAERAPTVVVLEDLHWMDNASREVLAEVLADAFGQRMLVIAAHRPGWTVPWSEWGWPERLSLRPLGEREAAALAGAVLGGVELSPDLERHVAERAGGNPFFVEEMLRALQEAGDLEQREGHMYLVPGAVERLPSTLTEVLLARLDRLEGEVRSLTQMASVIGRNFAVRLLARVSGQDAQALEHPLATLQRAEIAFPRRGPDLEYVFKHVSMREVAYNTLVQKRRQALHLATAQAISQLYPNEEYVEMIAYHYARTEEYTEAAQWLERAGDRAAGVYANEAALSNYREARRRLEPQPTEQRAVARLNEKLGEVLGRVGHYDEALETLERAAGTYRDNRDLEAVGRVTARIGWTHRWRGTPQEGVERIQPVLDLLAWSGPSPGLASLYLALAYLHFGSGRYRETLDAAERAGELARAVGDERVLAGAEMRRGTALSALGQVEESRRVLERSIQLAEAAGELDVLGMALNNLADLELKMGELQRSREHLEQALELHERAGHTGNIGFQMVNLGELLTYLGEWEEASEFIDRGGESIRSAGATWWSAYGPVHRGLLRLRQGEWEEASRALEEGIALAEPIGDLQALQRAHTSLGELEVRGGRADAARTHLEPLRSEEGSYIESLLATLAWAYLELGEDDQAEEAVRRARDMAQERRHTLSLVEVLTVQGMIQARQGRWDEAEQTFEELITLARAMPYPYAEGRAHQELGTMYTKQGGLERARGRLEQALAIFLRLGAKKDVEQTEEMLAECAGA